jgi:hypothetical protein
MSDGQPLSLIFPYLDGQFRKNFTFVNALECKHEATSYSCGTKHYRHLPTPLILKGKK